MTVARELHCLLVRGAQPDCHGRTNPTDRTNAGAERGRNDVARVARFPGAKSAGAAGPTKAAAGADRKTKTRTGRAEPAPGRTRARPRGNDGQALALPRHPRTRRIRLPEEARDDSRDARKFHAAFATARSDRAQDLEHGGVAEGAEPRAQYRGRCADGIQPATQPARSRECRSSDGPRFAGGGFRSWNGRRKILRAMVA